jgi:hypothetical protein
MVTPRRLTIALGTIAVLAASAATALATTQTAHSGNVSATFTFKASNSFNYSHERLKIMRAGQVVYDKPVTSASCGTTQCSPGAFTPHTSSVHVIDLESNGEPDVVLDLYSGGAHCCFIEQIFSFNPGSTTYTKTERDFGDPGANIKDLGHNRHFELVTADDSFADEFTDYAASGLPIQILTFRNRRFTDVTRHYPKLIASDAAQWLSLFKGNVKHHVNDSVGLIAAWAADEDLLGHESLVKSTLATELAKGHLRTPLGNGGSAFVKALQKFLRKRGYTH